MSTLAILHDNDELVLNSEEFLIADEKRHLVLFDLAVEVLQYFDLIGARVLNRMLT